MRFHSISIQKCKTITHRYTRKQPVSKYMPDSNNSSRNRTVDTRSMSTVTSSMNFYKHIQNITVKAKTSLGLIERHFTFYNRTFTLRILSYALIRSHLAFSDTIRDPIRASETEVIKDTKAVSTFLLQEFSYFDQI